MARKYVDFKVTVWCRAHLDDVDMTEVVEAMKKGEGSNYLFAEELAYEWETLSGTEEPLSVEENQGNCTVEVYDGDELIWDNTQKIV